MWRHLVGYEHNSVSEEPAGSVMRVGNSEPTRFLFVSEDIFCFTEQLFSDSAILLIRFLMNINAADIGSGFLCAVVTFVSTVTPQKTAIFIASDVSKKVKAILYCGAWMNFCRYFLYLFADLCEYLYTRFVQNSVQHYNVYHLQSCLTSKRYGHEN